MCGGICGPTGENISRNSYHNNKPIKQRKVPYENHSGTVLASCTGVNTFVEMCQHKKDKSYIVSWHGNLSSGAASYTNKRNAISEYNSKVPDKFKIKK